METQITVKWKTLASIKLPIWYQAISETEREYVGLLVICHELGTVTVISVPDQLAEKLEPSDDSSGPSYIDYSERRSLPISIPDYQYAENGADRHVVSCVSAGGWMDERVC